MVRTFLSGRPEFRGGGGALQAVPGRFKRMVAALTAPRGLH